MVLSKKSKCAGCIALENPSNGKYVCILKFSIDYSNTAEGKAFGPTPLEKCYKPTDKGELENAKGRIIKREKSEE